jgi:hypothetical protein
MEVGGQFHALGDLPPGKGLLVFNWDFYFIRNLEIKLFSPKNDI